MAAPAASVVVGYLLLTAAFGLVLIWRTKSDAHRRAGVGSLGPFVLTAVFLGFGIVSTSYHELWRDELEFWDTARTSGSLMELRANARYQGQPPLWSLCLFGLTRFTNDPRAMQFLNLAAVTAAAALLAYRSPFLWWQKWLLAFSYFPFFEYGTISRHYGLGLLFLFAWCSAWYSRPRGLLGSALSLALLALSHFHATIVALAALAAAVVDHALDRRRPTRREAAGAGLVAAAIGVAVFFAVPPADSTYLHEPFRIHLGRDRLMGAAAHLWRGYAPWPPWGFDSFWNKNALDIFPAAQAVLGLFLGAAFGWSLRRARTAFLFFLAGTGGLFFFYCALGLGFARHDGMFFLVLVSALWVAGGRPPSLSTWASWLFTIVLATQFGAGLIATGKDLTRPFSRSGVVAKALEAPELAGLPIVGDSDFTAAAVAAHLQRPIFFVGMGRFATRVVWTQDRLSAITREDLGAAVRRVQRESGLDVLLLLNYELDPIGRFEKVNCFTGAIVANENYCLYRARRRPAD